MLRIEQKWRIHKLSTFRSDNKIIRQGWATVLFKMALEKWFAPMLCRALEAALFSPSRAALVSGVAKVVPKSWLVCWVTQCSKALPPGACLGSPRTTSLQKSLHQTFSRAVQCYWCLSRTFILKEARSISLAGLQTLTPHKKDAHALLIWNASLIIFWYTFCSPLLTSQHCFNYGLGSNRQLLHHWNKNARKQPWRTAKRFHVQMENGGIQHGDMDCHSQGFHTMSSTPMARGTQEPPREHEQTSDGCGLTCSSGKGALPAAQFALKSSSVSGHVHFHGASRISRMEAHFALEQKKKAKFMTFLAFQKYSFPSPELALERAITSTELSLTVKAYTFVILKHCSCLFFLP